MSRKALLLLISALLVACSGAPGIRLEDATAKELKAMAGVWRVVATENNGFKSADGDWAAILWIRDADGRWTAERDGKPIVEWTVKNLDPTQKPKTIDIEVAAGPYKGVVYLGIYELDGDTLRICFTLPDRPGRPTSFSAARGTVRAFSEFKRVKD